MLNLLIHKAELIREEKIGDDDGTPLYDLVPVWEGPCREDSQLRGTGPRQNENKQKEGPAGAANIRFVRSKLFVMPDCPVRHLDHMDVTIGSVVLRWRVDGIFPRYDAIGLHHIEMDITRAEAD